MRILSSLWLLLIVVEVLIIIELGCRERRGQASREKRNGGGRRGGLLKTHRTVVSVAVLEVDSCCLFVLDIKWFSAILFVVPNINIITISFTISFTGFNFYLSLSLSFSLYPVMCGSSIAEHDLICTSVSSPIVPPHLS